MKILILCTGNSCRSQMAEAFLKHFDTQLEVFSAGTEPAQTVHPMAIRVMSELNIDISGNKPKHVNEFLNNEFDYVITVCDEANDTCPVFHGRVKKRLHIGFYDPARATGTEQEVLQIFRLVRDQIRERFFDFYRTHILENK